MKIHVQFYAQLRDLVGTRELDIDRVEIRRRNFIPAAAFPYNNEIIYQDFAPLEYDSGNYAPVLDKALAAIGYDHFREQQSPVGRSVVSGKAREFLIETLEAETEAERLGVFDQEFADLGDMRWGFRLEDQNVRRWCIAR